MQANRTAIRTPMSTRIAAVALISLSAVALNLVPLVADAAGRSFSAPTMHQGFDGNQADDTPMEAGVSIAAYER